MPIFPSDFIIPRVYPVFLSCHTTPFIVMTFASHPIAQEKAAADDGTLDIVCGFMVIDEDSRTIVLEGKSGPQEGLTTLLRKVGRTGPNGQAYRALENPEVRFAKRLYTSFDADLKKVRTPGSESRYERLAVGNVSVVFTCARAASTICSIDTFM